MQKTLPLLATAVAITSLFLTTLFPSEAAWMPEGFTVPIIAYEFLLTNAEVSQFFGPPSAQRAEWVAGMYKGHQWDSLYLVLYSVFLALWGAYAVQQTRQKWFYAVSLLAILAAVSDIFENRQLVAILEILDTSKFDNELSRLFIFTWLKWGSLAIALAGLSLFTKQRGWLGKIHLGIGVLTLILGVVAFFNRSVVTSWFTVGITMQFLLLIILSFMVYWKDRKK